MNTGLSGLEINAFSSIQNKNSNSNPRQSGEQTIEMEPREASQTRPAHCLSSGASGKQSEVRLWNLSLHSEWQTEQMLSK